VVSNLRLGRLQDIEFDSALSVITELTEIQKFAYLFFNEI